MTSHNIKLLDLENNTIGGVALQEFLVEGRLVVTPELAKRILKELRYARQRRVYPHHIARFVEVIKHGTWLSGSQIAFGRLNGRLHLMNGYHRLSGIVEAGVPAEVQVLLIDVADEDELDRLFSRFDVIQRDRSRSEVIRATQTAELQGVSPTLAHATAGAAVLLASGLQLTHYTEIPALLRNPDGVLDAALPWWPHARTFATHLETASAPVRKKLLNVGPTAVALATLRYAPQQAAEFWSGVCADDGLRRGDPRHTLVRALDVRTVRNTLSAERVMIPGVAWNAWYRGESIAFIRATERTPVVLLGTPFRGRPVRSK